MPRTESVLVSVSIVVSAPVSDPMPQDAMGDSVQEDFLDAVADRLAESVKDLSKKPWFEEYAGVSYHYLSADSPAGEQNAHRCARCGRWTSDMNAPQFLTQLAWGKSLGGALVCTECLASEAQP